MFSLIPPQVKLWLIGGFIAIQLLLVGTVATQHLLWKAARERAYAAETALKAQREAYAALDRELQAARQRAEQAATLRREVYAQPSTTACLSSPAVRAALAGLRSAAPVASAPGSVSVPAAAVNPARATQ